MCEEGEQRKKERKGGLRGLHEPREGDMCRRYQRCKQSIGKGGKRRQNGPQKEEEDRYLLRERETREG